jgi:cation diffusion facilitator CzcD-associated flavoprotein CzcO
MTATVGGLRADSRLRPAPPARAVPVAVIGAGQAGLSAAYHLGRRGLDYVVLDGEDGPDGAWRHRWRSLRMETVNGIFDLPGRPKPLVDPGEPAADAVPRYFAAYERELGLPVLRPVRVHAVRDAGPPRRRPTGCRSPGSRRTRGRADRVYRSGLDRSS